MSATLDFTMAAHGHRFRAGGGEGKEARWPVLTALILHKNNRNRVWAAPETIAEEWGIGRARVIQAEKWLAEHGAIYLVPPEHRAGEEAKLHPNRNVWQITGLANVDGVVFTYLYMRDEARAEMLAEMQKIAPEEVAKLFMEEEKEAPAEAKDGGLKPAVMGTEVVPKEGGDLSTEVEPKNVGIRTENEGDLGTDSVSLPYTEQESDQKINMDQSTSSSAAAGEGPDATAKSGDDDGVIIDNNVLEKVLTELRMAGVNVNEGVRRMAAGWSVEEIKLLIARSGSQRGLKNTAGWIVSQMRLADTLKNIRAEIIEEKRCEEQQEELPPVIFDAHVRAWREYQREKAIERQNAARDYVIRQREEFLASGEKLECPALGPEEIWECARERLLKIDLPEADRIFVRGLKYAGAKDKTIYIQGNRVPQRVWLAIKRWIAVKGRGEWTISKLAEGETPPLAPPHSNREGSKQIVLIGKQSGRDAEAEIKTAFEIAPGVMIIPPGATPPPDPLPAALEERVQARIDALDSELYERIMEIRQ